MPRTPGDHTRRPRPARTDRGNGARRSTPGLEGCAVRGGRPAAPPGTGGTGNGERGTGNGGTRRLQRPAVRMEALMDGAERGHRRSIYVEILVRGGLDDLWSLTQRPELHRRWDLRFSDIEYLPRPDESLPQRFLYTTRIGFGLAIRGWGESTGVREAGGGTRTSALRFWSADPKSLIREGSGYWRYVPVPGGVRFLTRYDYRTRFGLAGRLLDRALFRPLLGWATAWSFDRLRLWIEREIDPRAALRRGLLDLAVRLGLASVLLGHGLVSMLIDRSPGALRLLVAAGLTP